MPEGAIYVGRPSLWGNPWPIADVGRVYPEVPIADRPAAAVTMYRRELEHWGLLSDYGWYVSDETYDRLSATIAKSGASNMTEYTAIALRGRDLACWCPLCERHANGRPLSEPCADCEPCHADVLLTLANQ